jgi:hypothetical protein
MALNAACVFEMRTAGAATNGGGYKTGASGTDFSQQDAAQYALTGGTSAGAGAVVLHASAAADMVGNVARIAGTNTTTGWYEITSVVASTSITVDRNCTTGVGSNITVNVGGAVSTFQDLFFETLEPGNIVYIKSGTYNMTESLSVAKDGTAPLPIRLIGYGTTRGDNPLPSSGNQPLIDGVTSYTFIFDDHWWFMYLDHISGTNVGTGWYADTNAVWAYCKSYVRQADGNAEAIDASSSTINQPTIIGCEITGSSSARGINTQGSARIIGNYIHGLAQGVLLQSKANTVLFNVFKGCTTALNNNYNNQWAGDTIVNNTIYGAEAPSGVGIANTYSGACVYLNNIFYGLTTGMNNSASLPYNFIDYNNYYNNTTNKTNIAWTGANETTLNPAFTDAANKDWSIGANMKAVGYPRTITATNTDSAVDLGAAQSEPPTGGGSGWFGGE